GSQIKVIVFIGNQLPPRISRISKWIRKGDENIRTILLCYKSGYYKMFSNKDWNLQISFRNKYHLKRLINNINNIYLVHAFAPKSYYPYIILKNFNFPFIIDYQDVIATYYGLNSKLKWVQNELPIEKYCFANAHGIVAQSPEPIIGFRTYRITNKPKNIFFPLYCDDDQLINKSKELVLNDIHLVYAGGVAGSHRKKSQYGHIQFHKLISDLSAQKINLHIYPSPSNLKADYEEYQKIASKNPYFHFHDPIPNENLTTELSKYHFGILPFLLSETKQTTTKFKNANALKLFNYMEAGIPIIVSNDLHFQKHIVLRYHSGFAFDFNEAIKLKESIKLINYDKLSQDIIINRNSISLKHQISRLLRFYDLIHDKVQY
ncbi:hypothetical protein ACFLRZ_04090, partial [Bacteroidota bacterium]